LLSGLLNAPQGRIDARFVTGASLSCNTHNRLSLDTLPDSHILWITFPSQP